MNTTKNLFSLLLLIGITTFINTQAMDTVPPKKQASHLLKTYFKLLFPDDLNKIVTPEKAHEYYNNVTLTIETAKKTAPSIANQAAGRIKPIVYGTNQEPFNKFLKQFLPTSHQIFHNRAHFNRCKINAHKALVPLLRQQKSDFCCQIASLLKNTFNNSWKLGSVIKLFPEEEQKKVRNKVDQFNDQLCALHYLIGLQPLTELELEESFEILSKLNALFKNLLKAQTKQAALEVIETIEVFETI